MDKQDRTLTLEEFLNFVEKNGWPQITGDFFLIEDKEGESRQIKVGQIHSIDTKVIGACVLGQGILNLEKETEQLVQAGRFYDQVNPITGDYWDNNSNGAGILAIMAELNDAGQSIQDIVSFIRARYKSDLNTILHY